MRPPHGNLEFYLDLRVVWSHTKAHETVWNGQCFEQVHLNVFRGFQQFVRSVKSSRSTAHHGYSPWWAARRRVRA